MYLIATAHWPERHFGSEWVGCLLEDRVASINLLEGGRINYEYFFANLEKYFLLICSD